MTRREDQRKQTLERIMNAAAACFAEKGYSGCSLQDIVERAGMSKGAIYVYFRSKEDLFKAIIHKEHSLGIERTHVASARPPYLGGIILYMSECIQNSGFPIDHRLWAEVLAVAARDPSIKETFVASERELRKFWIGMLQKVADAGEMDASLDLNAVAIWLIALGDGLIIRVADDPEFDFRTHLPIFEKLVRRALRP